MNTREFVSVEDASRLLGLPCSQVLSFAEKVRVRTEKDGAAWHLSRGDLQRWISGTAQRPDATDSTPEFGTADSRDLDHYHAQPGHWQVRVDQLSNGPFKSHIRFLKLPGLTIYDNRWGRATLVRGEAPPGLLMMGTDVTPEHSCMRWCGRKADSQHFACASPGKAIDFSLSEQAHDVVLLIEPDLLQQAAGYEAVRAIEDRLHLTFDHAPGGHLVDLILRLVGHYETHSLLLQQPGTSNRIRSEILRALEDCFADLQPAMDDLPPGFRERAVDLALSHAEEVRGQTTAWDMARAAGVSQRALEYAFRQALDMTPGKYLTLIRLNSAHHELAHAQRGALTVTEVAFSMGFSHLGRFSAHYRELFGEKPSVTLDRPAFTPQARPISQHSPETPD